MSIRIDGTNTTANPGITGSDTDTGLQFGTNEVKIVTDGSDRVTVDSSGNFGIGTSSPGNKLALASTADENVYVQVDNDDTSAFIGVRSDGLAAIETNQATIFTTGASYTERMRILSGGGLTFNGDTADANALDDYEEGEWTPAAQHYDGTMTVVSADYVKVGQLVHVNMYVSFSNTSDGSDINITGLPFTVAGDANNHYSLFTAHTNGNLPNFHLRPQGTTNQMLGVYLTASDGDNKPSYNNVANKFIIMGGTYRCTP